MQQGLEKFSSDKSLHLNAALLLTEQFDAPDSTIEFHFRSNFTVGDHNFDGRFYYAEYLFWAGKIDEASKLFVEIDNRAEALYRRAAPSSEDVLTAKLVSYQGIIESVNERFFSIRFGGYNNTIFAHWTSLHDGDYDTLRSGQS